MVDVMDPGPDEEICDPACGTGGFFLRAYDHILRHCDRNPTTTHLMAPCSAVIESFPPLYLDPTYTENRSGPGSIAIEPRNALRARRQA